MQNYKRDHLDRTVELRIVKMFFKDGNVETKEQALRIFVREFVVISSVT